MNDKEKILRLTCLWLPGAQRSLTESEAEDLLIIYREMRAIDHDEAEESRIAHAREMSKPKR